MKRILSFILVLAMSLTLCLSFVSCGNEDKIKYGKEYILEYGNDSDSSKKREVLVFNKDGTGTYEYFYRNDSDDDKYDYTISGTLSFVWEKTNDGAIHMFETKVKYNKDNTDGKTITAISEPLYFSENMIYYSYVTGLGSSVRKYILEGSDLYEEVYD